MLLIAFKLIVYGTARVKRPSMLICVFLCTRRTFHIIILYPYWRNISRMFPNQYANASFNSMTMWGHQCWRRVSQAGILCLFMPETRPSGDCPNMIRGDFTQSYLRNHLLKWLVQACSISYQLYIGYRYYLYALFISIYYIYIHDIYFYTFIVIQWCLSM